jgi:hypothetical protein
VRRRMRERLAREPARPQPAAPRAAAPAPGRSLLPMPFIAALGGATLLLLGLSTRARPVASPAAPPPPTATMAGTPRPRALPPPRLAIAPAADLAAATATAAHSGSLARDLVGYWPLDDRAGSAVAVDRSGHGRQCTMHGLDRGTAWIPGARAGALQFGFDGFLECPQPALPRRPTAALSVAAWVKRGGNPRNHRAIAMRASGTGRANYFFFGFVEDRLKVIGSGWEGTLSAPVPDAPGRWIHVAFTHALDRSTRLYVDGVEVRRSTSRPRPMGAADGPLYIGGGLEGERKRVRQLFEGALDDVLVYERALTEEEIRALAAGTAELPTP